MQLFIIAHARSLLPRLLSVYFGCSQIGSDGRIRSLAASSHHRDLVEGAVTVLCSSGHLLLWAKNAKNKKPKRCLPRSCTVATKRVVLTHTHTKTGQIEARCELFRLVTVIPRCRKLQKQGF